MVMSIYFPKAVAIDNPRLFMIQNVCNCATALLVLISTVYTKIAWIDLVLPDSLTVPYVVVPNVTVGNTSHNMYWGTNSEANWLQAKALGGLYNYEPKDTGFSFTFPKVAIPCNGHNVENTVTGGSSTFGTSCMAEGESYKVSKGESIRQLYLEDAMFIPTAYIEVFDQPGKNAIDCPFAAGLPSGEMGCKMSSNHLVPGVEDFEVKIAQKYKVIPPESQYHEMTGINREIKGRLQVAVVDADDEQVGIQFIEEEVVSLSVRKLMELVGTNLDAAVPQSNVFPENGAKTRNANATITPRVTGMELTIEMDYLNQILPDVGPLCNIKVTGEPAWMSVTETQVVNQEGGTKTRHYQGMRIRIIRKGAFEYFKAQELIASVTTFIVWIRIPAFMVFYFAVFCLGTLSKIYTRYLYEDLNLINEFNGVSARLLKRAHGFNDLHDLVHSDGTRAISYEEAKRRLYYILEGRKELDESEKDYFVQFFFSQCASVIGANEDTPIDEHRFAITLDKYLGALSSEEKLQYDEVMMFVDTDGHKMTCMEKLFMDSSLKTFLSSKKNKDILPPVRASSEDLGEGGEIKPTLSQESGEKQTPLSKSGSQLSARKSLNRSNSIKKQADLFTIRGAGKKLNSQLDALTQELDGCRQHRDQLLDRQSNYLHYLAYLQEKIQQLAGKQA
jgi:hypothetical protein